jgi:glycerol-3-phosphate acyltransferase PlsY
MQYFFILSCFLLGSLNGSFFLMRFFGLNDIVSRGSGNPGTTNVIRLYGMMPGLFVFFVDVMKSFLPIACAKSYGFESTALLQGLAACVIGHCYSPLLRFDGGKGVATLLGGLAAYNSYIAAKATIIWALVYIITSLSALSALSMTMFLAGYLFDDLQKGLILALFVLYLPF